MKCRESEKNIYLYNELTARERADTDEHVRTCASCSLLMERVINFQNVMKSHRSHTPPMTNHAQMTRRIMDAFDNAAERRNAPRHWFAFDFNMNALRYGMAAVSFFLVALFIGQFSMGPDSLNVVKHNPRTSARRTELNLASFNTAFLKSKENDGRPLVLLWECVNKCLQPETRDCEACVNKFAKPF